MFIYLFASFYILERIFSLFIEISILKPPKWEILLLLILNPLHLEEFFFLVRWRDHEQYIKSGIVGQALVICIFGIPQQIIAIVWVVNYELTILNVILASFIMATFITSISFLTFNSLYSDCNSFSIVKSKEKLNLFIQYLHMIFHFLTFIWMFCLNFRQTYFWYFVLTIFLILIGGFIFSVKKRIQSNFSYQKHRFFLIQILLCFKEIFHCIFDIRKLDQVLFKFNLNKYGLRMHNKMILLEFLQKVTLLVAYSLLFFNQLDRNDKMYSFYTTLFVLSCLSTLLLGYKVNKYIIEEKFNLPQYLEFEQVKEFLDYSKQANKSQSKKLKAIQVFQKENPESIEETKLIIENLLFSHGTSEIYVSTGNRVNNSRILQEQIVKIDRPLEIEVILNIFKNQRMLSQIKEVSFILQNYFTQIDLYKQLSEYNLGVCFKTQNDEYNLMQAQQQQIESVRVTTLQILVFNKYIKKQQTVNPYQISYDLYDTFNY